MELVEGEDLSQRIARGAVPLEEALPIARQIAEALEAAHEQGIIHRDLKPANIKLRPDGVVKVLDFGLAKAPQPSSVGSVDVTASPTITSPAVMTSVGVVLGTAAYMSPEQARGQAVDKRTDIWAFGCVLYETLTGKRAFAGENGSEVFASTLAREPEWRALPAEVPPALRVLLRRCLEKSSRDRVADISTALFVLKEQATLATPVGAAFVAPLTRRPPWRHVAVLTAGALVIAAIASAVVWSLTRPAPPSVVRTTVTTSGTTALTLGGMDRDLAITPDGSRIVYRGSDQLLVRSLNQLEPTVLSGLGAPQGVFTSPDGQWVGYLDGFSLLKKVAITGGSPVTLCVIQGVPRGATWSENGTVIFATNAPATGLQRVSAAGGEASVLTTPDRERGEGDHVWPDYCLEGKRSSLRLLRPTAFQRRRRSRCWICRPARRRYLFEAEATRRTCRRGISSTALQGRCAPWHSTSAGWTCWGRRPRCSRAW